MENHELQDQNKRLQKNLYNSERENERLSEKVHELVEKSSKLNIENLELKKKQNSKQEKFITDATYLVFTFAFLMVGTVVVALFYRFILKPILGV